MQLNQSFCVRVWNESKFLFAVLAIFILAQIYVTYTERECFPWLNWGMYSSLHNNQASFTTYRIFIADKQIKTSALWDPQREVVLGTLHLFDRLRANNFNDPLVEFTNDKRLLNDSATIKKYPAWLLRYLADMRLLSHANMCVLKDKVEYSSPCTTHLLTTDTLIRLYE